MLQYERSISSTILASHPRLAASTNTCSFLHSIKRLLPLLLPILAVEYYVCRSSLRFILDPQGNAVFTIRSTFSDIVTCCVLRFNSYTCNLLGIASAASRFFLLDDVPIVEEAADGFETGLRLLWTCSVYSCMTLRLLHSMISNTARHVASIEMQDTTDISTGTRQLSDIPGILLVSC